MFVPGGWWHAVINLDNTIAITENICNQGNFERVWTQTRKSRKRLAYRWLKLLRRNENLMYKIAIEMNKRDNFVMWRPPGEVNDQMSGQGDSSTPSSSTSSSSPDSSDDMRTIDIIRDGLPDLRDSQSQIDDLPKVSFDREIWQINKDIKKTQRLDKLA